MPAAARVGDSTMAPLTGVITGPGCATVMINKKPAAIATDMETGYPAGQIPPGTFTVGSTSVFIGGKPAIRVGDVSTSGLTPAVGEPTVIIG
jgi:uncharacterized Zn-binding protein involved in type VI secretion